MCHVNSAHKTTTLVDAPNTWKSQCMTDRVVRGGSISALTVLELSKRVPANQKQGASWTDAMASITQYSIGLTQGISKKMHNQVGTGMKAHKIISSETKQTKTSQTMDVTLIMKTKGSKRVQTTTNRMIT